MPKNNLTPEEKSAQLKFKAAWKVWQAKDKKNRTQQLIADQLGINQPSLGQYINGINPLNIDFLLRACSLMKIDPRGVYPEIFSGIDFSIVASTGDDQLDELISLLKQRARDSLGPLREIVYRLPLKT